jgi:hypothetical protein
MTSQTTTPIGDSASATTTPDVFVIQSEPHTTTNPMNMVEQMFRGVCLPGPSPHVNDTPVLTRDTKPSVPTTPRHVTEAPATPPPVYRPISGSAMSSSTPLPSDAVPTLIQATPSTCSVSDNSLLEDDEIDGGNEDIQLLEDNDEDADEDDNLDSLVIAETVSGTSRFVRVGKGLELFACTVALLVVTVWTLKRYTGVDFFDLEAKLVVPVPPNVPPPSRLSWFSSEL